MLLVLNLALRLVLRLVLGQILLIYLKILRQVLLLLLLLKGNSIAFIISIGSELLNLFNQIEWLAETASHLNVSVSVKLWWLILIVLRGGRDSIGLDISSNKVRSYNLSLS